MNKRMTAAPHSPTTTTTVPKVNCAPQKLCALDQFKPSSSGRGPAHGRAAMPPHQRANASAEEVSATRLRDENAQMKSGAVEQVSSGTDLIHPPARLPPLRFRCLGRVAIPERVEVPRFIRAVGCKHDLNALAVPYRRSGSSGCRHGYKRWRERFSCRCARRQVAG